MPLDPEPDGGYARGNTAEGENALSNIILTGNANNNTAVGFNALSSLVAGDNNTAVGMEALRDFSSALNQGDNTALGFSALANHENGQQNTAIGSYALINNLNGRGNTAVGFEALLTDQTEDPGSDGANANTAIGRQAMRANNTGASNVALGAQALESNVSGSRNIAVGFKAGIACHGDDNIDIGNQGATESHVIRIGTQTIQNAAYIAGIYGSAIAGGSPVVVDSNGHLGEAGTGYIVFVVTGSQGPIGFTKLGTWSTAYKDTDGHGRILEADIYRKD